jgi:hypothetical protein
MATTTTKSEPKPAPDPVGKATEPVKVKTIADEGVDVRDPYPTGAPADPEEAFFAAHGFRRAKE